MLLFAKFLHSWIVTKRWPLWCTWFLENLPKNHIIRKRIGAGHLLEGETSAEQHRVPTPRRAAAPVLLLPFCYIPPLNSFKMLLIINCKASSYSLQIPMGRPVQGRADDCWKEVISRNNSARFVFRSIPLVYRLSSTSAGSGDTLRSKGKCEVIVPSYSRDNVVHMTPQLVFWRHVPEPFRSTIRFFFQWFFAFHVLFHLNDFCS